MSDSKPARLFIALVVVSGLAVLGAALPHPRSDNYLRFVAFFLAACLAGRLRVKLPGLTGSLSVNLPFILIAVAALTAAESLLIGCFSTLVQCLPRARRKFNFVQAAFNFSNMALSIGAARFFYHSHTAAEAVPSHSLLLAIAAAAYFVVNSFPVAVIISLTESKSVLRAWKEMFQLSFPYFALSAGMAGVAIALPVPAGLAVPAALLPLMLMVFLSYKRYFLTAVSTPRTAFEQDSKSVATRATH